MAAMGIWERPLGTSIAWSYFASIILLCFFYSCFVAWRDEARSRLVLAAQAKPRLSICFSGGRHRPECQVLGPHEESGSIEQCLFRIAIQKS